VKSIISQGYSSEISNISLLFICWQFFVIFQNQQQKFECSELLELLQTCNNDCIIYEQFENTGLYIKLYVIQ